MKKLLRYFGCYLLSVSVSGCILQGIGSSDHSFYVAFGGRVNGPLVVREIKAFATQHGFAPFDPYRPVKTSPDFGGFAYRLAACQPGHSVALGGIFVRRSIGMSVGLGGSSGAAYQRSEDEFYIAFKSYFESKYGPGYVTDDLKRVRATNAALTGRRRE